MSYRFFVLFLTLLNISCATLDDSLQLGAGLGAASGVAATYAGHSATGKSPSFETVAAGAGIGLGLGLITSYFTHKKIAEDRLASQSDQVEMHFGDLPPSPFIFPKINSKKGAR